jgi:DNA-binding transcriptional MerR regulator
MSAGRGKPYDKACVLRDGVLIMSAVAEDRKLYKIGEVCKMADVQPYVLRYWETEFPALVPNKSGGGQRMYSRAEVDIVLRIKDLLYKEGFTIAGAKKKLEAELNEPPGDVAAQPAVAGAPGPTMSGSDSSELRGALDDVKKELRELLTILAK